MDPAHNYLDAYLDDVLARGRYAVTLAELTDRFDVSDQAIQQSIYRLKRKGRLAHVRKGFYAIVPPQYAARGMVPASLIIDDLMGHLERPYYVGALSAAALHGAGHQQPMQFQVMITKPALRPIRSKTLDIHFFVKKGWHEADLTEWKTESGFMQVSSPSLTAFDLVQYNTRIGGLDRIIPILEDLVERIRPSDLRMTADHQNVPDIQRLGYLLDRLGNDPLAAVLARRLETEQLRDVPMSLAHAKRSGERSAIWSVIVNSELDI